MKDILKQSGEEEIRQQPNNGTTNLPLACLYLEEATSKGHEIKIPSLNIKIESNALVELTAAQEVKR